MVQRPLPPSVVPSLPPDETLTAVTAATAVSSAVPQLTHSSNPTLFTAVAWDVLTFQRPDRLHRCNDKCSGAADTDYYAAACGAVP